MLELDGYITDLSLEEAVAILDSMFYNSALARGCGKTRMVMNYMTAWTKVRSCLPLKDNVIQNKEKKQ